MKTNSQLQHLTDISLLFTIIRQFPSYSEQRSIHPLTFRVIPLSSISLGVSLSIQITCLTHGGHPHPHNNETI